MVLALLVVIALIVQLFRSLRMKQEIMAICFGIFTVLCSSTVACVASRCN